MADTLCLVVPCYNEQEVLPETSTRLLAVLDNMVQNKLANDDSRILFVDDGSKDTTWSLITKLSEEHKQIMGVKLSRNRGHQNALMAGLMTAKEFADVTISLDADLQDDLGVLPEFMTNYYDGCDIVFGVRKDRSTDTAFKRGSAQSFYKLLKAFGVEVVFNHADYRLMSKRALESLAEFGEVNLFLRGIVMQIGYKTAKVEYDRGERFAGESKYPLSKMLQLAFDGITSFSIKPIRMITVLGMIIFLVSIAILIYSLIVNAMGHTVTGWTSTMISVWILGGLQLLAIGVVGEYVGKVYMETKKRPKYIIEKIVK
ncbi:MAG: glycosyltransferase family 2 protein [Eubacteriales bacterium]